MRIQFKDPDVERISANGQEFDKTEEGVFDVPHDVAQLFLAQPHVARVWDGLPWPRVKTPQEFEAERVANLVRTAMTAVEDSRPTVSRTPRAPRRKKAAPKRKAAKVSESAAAPMAGQKKKTAAAAADPKAGDPEK